MDKYDISNDYYCYRGTDILKNKLGIQGMDELERAEREITALTIRKITFNPPPYDLKYLQHLHYLLFIDLYEWAGELRSVDIAKGGTRFCNCTRIVPESQKIFDGLQKELWLNNLSKEAFCERLAEYYCECNMIHPFRERNGRVQRLLFEHLALAAGYDLNWENVSQNEWVQANIDGVNVDYEPMAKIFKRIVNAIT